MSDESTPRGLDGPIGPVGSDAAPAGGLKAFFATTVGKVVLIGGAVAILAAIVAVVAIIALNALSGGATPEEAQPQPVAGSTAGSVSQEATVPAVPVVENREVFTPRDPFKRVIVPASALATVTADGTAALSDTLVLTGIIDDGGVRKGVFTLNGSTYTVGDGERLGDTSWQVVTIGTSSATMLYGDTRIVVTVGEGIQTK